MSAARVPQIREVAIADSFAMIGGFPAWFLSRIVVGYPGGLERLLARSGIPPERRDDVVRAVGALAHVGTAWRLSQERGSAGSGTNIAEAAEPHAPSQHEQAPSNPPLAAAAWEALPLLSTAEVATVLRVSTRFVRRLAATGALRARRDGGRWRFDAAVVEAERERRMSGRGRADAPA
jgi:excisionase family DNA binding protein